MMISHLDTTAADERETARIALFAGACLRDANTVALRGLGDVLAQAAARGCIPLFTDNSQLVRIMQRLGWEKAGYEGEGGARSPVYRRIATVAKAA